MSEESTVLGPPLCVSKRSNLREALPERSEVVFGQIIKACT